MTVHAACRWTVVGALALAQASIALAFEFADVVDRAKALAAHAYAPHDDGTTIKQLPPPLHVRAGIDMPPLHAAAPQTVPLA